ncbi:unannotated protein [freshwater metagenome]|uniref:Unannotated protein n=1 Tax=freshwater metagenome TaxID=449393 RepID=A0A6J6IFQ5_9ZZZZ
MGPRTAVKLGCSDSLSNVKPETILKATFILAAMASLAASVAIYFAAGDDILGRLNGIYVGVWVPSILALGAFLLSGKGDKEKS